jgi:hypothetical protein
MGDKGKKDKDKGRKQKVMVSQQGQAFYSRES